MSISKNAIRVLKYEDLRYNSALASSGISPSLLGEADREYLYCDDVVEDLAPSGLLLPDRQDQQAQPWLGGGYCQVSAEDKGDLLPGDKPQKRSSLGCFVAPAECIEVRCLGGELVRS